MTVVPRFEQTYFSRFPGYYMSGDGAKRDKDGGWLSLDSLDILTPSS